MGASSIRRPPPPYRVRTATVVAVTLVVLEVLLAVVSTGRPAGATVAGTALADVAPAWAVRSIARPATTGTSALTGVSCVVTTTCVTVGSYTPNGGATAAFAEIRSGASWQVAGAAAPVGPGDQPPTGSEFAGVSCPTGEDCTAVGSFEYGAPGSTVYDALAERWNGTGFTVEPAPDPGGASQSYLSAVSCHSASSCMAVGNWDTAEGVRSALIERWNGTAWKLETFPAPAGVISAELDGVSCASATSCTAVGGDVVDRAGIVATLALVEQWNGTAWTIESTPSVLGDNTQLFGVACRAATWCTAVGIGDGTLAEVWNGTTWAVEPTPTPAGGGELTSVSCRSEQNCTAMTVGAEVFDGNAWTLGPTARIAGSAGSALAGVSCTAPDACTAVGDNNRSPQTPTALVETRA